MSQDTILIENALIDVQDYIVDLDDTGLSEKNYRAARKDDTYDFSRAIELFVSTYSGKNVYVQQRRRDLAKKKLTIAQERAVLVIMRDGLRDGSIERANTDDRRTNHTTVDAPPAPVEDNDVPVLADNATRLNIANLPDGRYAMRHPDKSKQFVFLSVRTMKKKARRDRRFMFGKRIEGSETYPAGTIEVREIVGQSRKLVGFQKPDEGYNGEYADELLGIMDNPFLWAMVFAKTIGSCPICGTILTDQESRDRGIGPVCRKNWGAADTYWHRFDRKHLIEVPTDAEPVAS